MMTILPRHARCCILLTIMASGMTVSAHAGPRQSQASPDVAPQLTFDAAQTWSCQPRKTCKRMQSGEEAQYYLYNCSWGGKLDGDSDGVPCESICGGG